MYKPELFVDHNIIIVTINYRLGPLGRYKLPSTKNIQFSQTSNCVINCSITTSKIDVSVIFRSKLNDIHGLHVLISINSFSNQ